MEFLRRRVGLIFRSLVSLLFIYLVVRNVSWEKVWFNVQAMDYRWLAASFIIFTPVLLIVSWRWRLLLTVHGVRLRYWRVLELNMIGQFFSAFLVGTTGGDFVKIFYVARAVPHHKAAVAFTVLVDRVVGLIALLLFGVLLSFTQLHLLLSHPSTRISTGIFYLFAIGGAVGAVGASFAPIFLKRPAIRDFFKRLPFAHRTSSVFAAYERTAQALGTNLVALIGSLPSHVCSVAMGYFILLAMHLHPNLLAFFSIIAIVNMLIALPVSISGVGLRETLFVTFFALLNIDGDRAVTFSLTFFFLNIIWSLLGAPFYFLYRHETHTPAPHVSEDHAVLSEI